MTNTCAQTRQWCMPAVVDRNGTFEGLVYAKADNFNSNVACNAVAVAPNGLVAAQTALTNVPNFGSPQIIHLSAIHVPNYGTLYACCEVGQGGSIINYHYY